MSERPLRVASDQSEQRIEDLKETEVRPGIMTAPIVRDGRNYHAYVHLESEDTVGRVDLRGS